MSWIAGVFRRDGRPVSDGVADRMMGAMRHLEPDAEGTWSGGAAALGHHGFHTTPESVHEAFPIAHGGLALVADARIDNRAELLGVLGPRLRAFGLVREGRPVTDGDLILAAYAEWGDACAGRLIGDFAFIVWDADRQTLFCARDPFGVRPLYVHDAEDRVVVASEPRGLFAAGVPDEVDETLVRELTTEGNVRVADRTMFRAVRLLPHAHSMAATREGTREWAHYVVAPSPDPVPTTDEGVERRFAELFREAVRCRMRGDVRTGSQLSGGLDSSAVAVVARDTLSGRGGGDLDTFTMAFGAFPEIDERVFSDAVLETGGFRPHTIDTDVLGPLANLEELYGKIDNGPAVGTQHYIWAMLKAGGEAGVRVMFDGIDGDVVVEHGQNRLHELAHAADWEAFFAEANDLLATHRGNTRIRRFELDFSHDVSHIFYIYGLPALEALAERGPIWSFVRSVRGAVKHGGLIIGSVLPRIWRRLLVPGPVLRRIRKTGPPPPRNVRAEQLETLRDSKLPRGLTLATHAAAVHGIELAHPFMDVRLVEFCLSLPSAQSLQGGYTRSILRRALRIELPPSVRDRIGKASLGPVYERALLELDLDLLDDAIARAAEMGGGVEDGGMVEARDSLLAAYERGEAIEGSALAHLGARAASVAWLSARGYGGDSGDGAPEAHRAQSG